MLARSSFSQVEECNILLSKLTSSDKKNVAIYTFYKWINSISDEEGAYTFRTGIATTKLAISDLVQNIRASRLQASRIDPKLSDEFEKNVHE